MRLKSIKFFGFVVLILLMGFFLSNYGVANAQSSCSTPVGGYSSCLTGTKNCSGGLVCMPGGGDEVFDYYGNSCGNTASCVSIPSPSCAIDSFTAANPTLGYPNTGTTLSFSFIKSVDQCSSPYKLLHEDDPAYSTCEVGTRFCYNGTPCLEGTGAEVFAYDPEPNGAEDSCGRKATCGAKVLTAYPWSIGSVNVDGTVTSLAASGAQGESSSTYSTGSLNKSKTYRLTCGTAKKDVTTSLYSYCNRHAKRWGCCVSKHATSSFR
jgi:hypothetical protein